MTVKERIILYSKERNINPSRIERLAGMSKGSLKASKSMNSDAVAELLRNEKELSAEWLMRGIGKMTITQLIAQEAENASLVDNSNNQGIISGDKSNNTIENKDNNIALQIALDQIEYLKAQLSEKDKTISTLLSQLCQNK